VSIKFLRVAIKVDVSSGFDGLKAISIRRIRIVSFIDQLGRSLLLVR
jgi:hypothetical protein